MSNESNFPRVLIIYISRVNKADQHGVSIRNWFGDWPKEKLAQIYSGAETGEGFCGANYKLSEADRRFGRYFFKIKDSSIGQSSYPIDDDKYFAKINKVNAWSILKNKISKSLINMGLWELVFRPLLSKAMIQFIKDFDPQVIYCQGYSLTFIRLPLMIHKKFNIPLCFQTGDDWPSYLYKDSLFSFAIQPIVHYAAKSLFCESSARLANGKNMAEVYMKRYKMIFEPIMMCDNLKRFDDAISKRVVNDDTASVVYTGNLGHGRWVSIVDLCKAAELLKNEGYKITITAFATEIPSESIKTLENVKNLQLLPGPSHEDLPCYLKGADILFLPETFDPAEATVINLSISTKAHLYMMSKRPVLVYGSPVTGIVNYANHEGWACIVQKRNLNKLASALKSILSNIHYAEKIINRGVEIVLQNHEEHKVRQRFLAVLKGIAKAS